MELERKKQRFAWNILEPGANLWQHVKHLTSNQKGILKISLTPIYIGIFGHGKSCCPPNTQRVYICTYISLLHLHCSEPLTTQKCFIWGKPSLLQGLRILKTQTNGARLKRERKVALPEWFRRFLHFPLDSSIFTKQIGCLRNPNPRATDADRISIASMQRDAVKTVAWHRRTHLAVATLTKNQCSKHQNEMRQNNCAKMNATSLSPPLNLTNVDRSHCTAARFRGKTCQICRPDKCPSSQPRKLQSPSPAHPRYAFKAQSYNILQSR